MNAIYLIDVVIDLSENYENIMKKNEGMNMRYFHFQTKQVIFYQFSSMNRKPFMVGNLCGKIVFLNIKLAY